MRSCGDCDQRCDRSAGLQWFFSLAVFVYDNNDGDAGARTGTDSNTGADSDTGPDTSADPGTYASSNPGADPGTHTDPVPHANAVAIASADTGAVFRFEPFGYVVWNDWQYRRPQSRPDDVDGDAKRRECERHGGLSPIGKA